MKETTDQLEEISRKLRFIRSVDGFRMSCAEKLTEVIAEVESIKNIIQRK